MIAFYAFQTHARKEKSFSEIIGKTLDGKAFHFEAEVKKHTLTVLNFWETWCSPCLRELPDLELTYQKYKDKEVLMIGIHSLSPLDKVKKLTTEYKISYPIVFIEEKNIKKHFDLHANPTTIVMDSSFNILRRYEGIDRELSDFISKQLNDHVETKKNKGELQ